MHRLVSPFILEKLQTDDSAGRFQAYVLFVDVVGFSKMSNALAAHGQHGAEVLAGILRAVFDPLHRAVYSQAGFITTTAGDAFTAVFPVESDPQPVSSDTQPYSVGVAERVGAKHALAAAWAIRTHMQAHDMQDTPYGTFPVAVKVGLTFGEVQWGILRSLNGTQDTARAAYYFSGTAIDEAAGAESHARENDVVIGPAGIEIYSEFVRSEHVDDYQRVLAIETALPSSDSVEIPDFSDPENGDRSGGQGLFFPQEVLALSAVGEFRESVNVFINLRGTPSAEQLQEFIRHVFQLQDKYGGVLNSVDFGDKGCKLLLFWGAPISHEKDVSRALDFLLELQEVSKISIRAGVTLRTGFAGFIGGDWHEEYTCFGYGVSLAARLMSGAPWESIWVDEPIGEVASSEFVVEYEEHFALKGFDEPQAAYVLLDRLQAKDATFYEGRMVGRFAELERLRSFVAPILNEDNKLRFAGMLVVSGEAGMGKSRLLHEFQLEFESDAGNEELQFFSCQTDQVVQTPLNPFRWWLRRYFSQSRQQSEARNKRAFSRKLRQVLAVTEGELGELLEAGRSFLGALLDLHWEDSRFEKFEPQERYENTLRVLRALILAETLQKPTVFIIEDVHWLDSDSSEFINRLVRGVGKYPLAVLATSRVRPKSELPVIDGRPAQVLPLANLASSSIEDLISLRLEGPAHSSLVALLAERAGGNPFILEQLLLYLRDADLLSETENGWAPSVEASDPARLPRNVRQVFTARLDQLAPAVRDLVQTGAVLGRDYSAPIPSATLLQPSRWNGQSAWEMTTRSSL